MFTCGPAFWGGSANADPFWSSVIYMNNYEGANNGDPAVITPDRSNYTQAQGGTTNAILSTSSPIEGSSSVAISNSVGRGFLLYYPGAESIIGTQDWTWEAFVTLDSSQVYAAPAIVRLGADSATNWVAGNVVLHYDHPTYPNVVSLWIYNFSTTNALLIGSTDIKNTGPKHVGWCRIGNTWRLFVNGAIEDTETWTGSVNSASRVRGVGGNNDATPDSITGKFDLVRETVGVGRYSAAFTPPLSYPAF
jgi:hypothetical protein